jgi:trimethylamine--corrinoid protein Co-methyltransferase
LQSRGIGSFEKLVLDAEIVSQIKRMLRPMEFTEDSLAMETIMNVGQKGNYLTQEHTFKHFRTEIYNPQIFTRNSYLNWEKNGSKDAYARANEKVKQMFESYEQPMLGQSMEKDMDTFAQAHYPVQMKNE